MPFSVYAYWLTHVRGHVLTTAQQRALKPKDTFKECDNCPEMTVVPAREFVMGSLASEPGHQRSEEPQHKVTIARPFAVSTFELTFDEWDVCAAHGDCDPYIKDGSFGRGLRPVILVSWSDAQTYIAWLATETGKPYRLLSEAE